MARKKKQKGSFKVKKAEKVVSIILKAAEKAGFTLEQIAAFNTPDDLKAAIVRVDPKAILTLETKPKVEPTRTIPRPPVPDMVDNSTTFEVKISAVRHASVNHALSEDMQVWSTIRARKIKNVQNINIIRDCVPNKKGDYLSVVTVNYKEKK